MTDETKDPTPNAQRPTPNAQRPTQAVDPSNATGTSRRSFLKGLTATAASVTAAAALSTASQQPASANSLPPSTSSPGSPLPWQPSVGLGHGNANLACGNGQFTLPVCGWGGKTGLSFALYFNSQSIRSSAVGAKWSYSYRMAVVTGQGTATVIQPDGSETVYTLSGSSYVPPVGTYSSLIHNSDGSWTLTTKSGMVYAFRSADGMLASITDPNGNAITLTYGSGSYLTSITDSVGRSLTLEYTGAQLTYVTDCQGRIWSLTYDTANLVTAIHDPAINGQNPARVIGYDANGNVNQITDRLGDTWQYTFDSSGNIQGATDPLGNGGSTNFAYLAQPKTGPSTAMTGIISSTKYVAWTDMNGNTTSYGLDSLGRHISTTTPLGNTYKTSYDSYNNKISTTTPLGHVSQFTYDSLGNNLVSQDPLGNQTTYTYGVNSVKTSITDAIGNKTTNTLDSKGNVTAITNPNGETTSFALNSDGSVSATTDPLGRVTSYTYDQYGNNVQTLDPLGNATSFTYDLGSHLTQRKSALGWITNYTLDAWGRTTDVAHPTTGNPGMSYSFDLEGHLVQSSDTTGVRTWTYDANGRKISATDPRGNTQANWDGVGNLLWQTDVTGRKISNSYNTNYQLTQVVDSTDNGTATLTYTADGQLNTCLYPNGVEVAYTYDAAGRVTNLTHTYIATSSLIVGYAATYLNNGQLSRIVESPSGDVTTYSYDPAGNLLNEIRTGQRPYSGAYTYWSDSNRKTADVITNGVTVHNGTYSYDGAGRLDQCIDSATGLTEIYSWNADGTLASMPGSGYTREFTYNEEAQLLGISHSGTLAYQYAYGADGNRRWSKDIANDLWTWYPCGVACGAGEMVEETSDLTGSSWTTSGQYLRAGGGCSSLLVRRKSSTDDEYHHEGINGDFNVFTGANAVILSNKVFDSFEFMQFNSGTIESKWMTSTSSICQESNMTYDGTQFYLPARALSTINWQLADCIYNCHSKKTDVGKALCVAACIQKYGKKGAGGGNSSGGCPTGTCTFKCQDEKGIGCGYPGTTITCKDGNKIPIPKNCASPKKKVSNTSCLQLGIITMPNGSVGVGITFACSF